MSVFLSSCSCRYNIAQEQKLAQETTVLVESYTVSGCPCHVTSHDPLYNVGHVTSHDPPHMASLSYGTLVCLSQDAECNQGEVEKLTWLADDSQF